MSYVPSSFDTYEAAHKAGASLMCAYSHLFYDYKVYCLELNIKKMKYQIIGRIIKIERHLLGLLPPRGEEEYYAVQKRIDLLMSKKYEELEVILREKENDYLRITPIEMFRQVLGDRE